MAELITQTSDAIVVGEAWISEHYFTTDAKSESFNALVRDRRKTWDAAAKEDDEETPRTRFTSARTSLLDAFATLDPSDTEELTQLHERIETILGFGRAGLIQKQDGPVTMVHASGIDRAGLAIVQAKPAESPEDLLAKSTDNLVASFAVDDKTELTNAARLISWLFLDEDHKPGFVLLLAGPHCLVAERERWPEGRYLAIDLQLVAERNDAKVGGEIDRALTCLSADSLAPDADGNTWWTTTLDKSVQHTVGVSKDLRDGVRLSIEIVANEVVLRRKAQGLDPLPPEEAQPLAKQALRFLYRILFLLYAEASPELGVLPTGASEYDAGYSIDRLRELTLVNLETPRSQHGTHLYDSLAVLFRLIDQGHDAAGKDGVQPGLNFRSLRADLFSPQATVHINEVRLGNAALQQVLQHLLLSKAEKGKKARDRGFISYSELGINQLGAVYEGLMSYTGRFAETDLYEVAKDGNAEKGSWLLPADRADTIGAKDFVKRENPTTGEMEPVLHPQGNFVFRLAGRERQQSASYYTPEVLTRFTVGQALEELLDQDGKTTTAEEILSLTICEPALGSGAFAIEAVRQLADEYLKRRQVELGETIDPDAYPRELQKVKAYLALHQVYGVDLNATAVELAEISLWLDTMVDGLTAPWFGLHLRRGNSLIGARRSGYPRFKVESKEKEWLKAAPDPINERPGFIHHFLLPAEGWGSAAEVGKDIRNLVPDEVKDLKDWRRGTKAKPTKKQIDRLADLSVRVERLWHLATRRLEIAEEQVRRDILLWGTQPSVEPASAASGVETNTVVTREMIEASLSDEDGAYRRLRRVMDAWCALWFWPLTETDVNPPTLDEWYDALTQILGTTQTMSKKHAATGDDTLDSLDTWDELENAEHDDRVYSRSGRMARILEAHPWLKVCDDVAAQQGFFHWQLDFATVFADRGGFDLQVGNPPWVRPDWDEAAALAELDVRFALEGKMPNDRREMLADDALTDAGSRGFFVVLAGDQVAIRESVSTPVLYPHLDGLRPDLYRCFMESTWTRQNSSGVVSVIHPETHFTDERAATLRAGTYRRLRRHWQFINELSLFEIDHHVSYGVHIYGAAREEPSFRHAVSLYHPETVERSVAHQGNGPEPGLKDADGNWDQRPHRSRILTVDIDTLRTWHSLLESSEIPVSHTRMVYTVNRSSADALRRLAHAERVGELGLEFSQGWNETTDFKKGYFGKKWGAADSWRDAILQGPHFHVGVPFYKQPNESMANNLDWSAVDLESLPSDALPVTSYKRRGDRAKYDRDYTHWGKDRSIPARDHYRVAWRAMAANTGERTLIPAIIPPGAAHPNGVFSVGFCQKRPRDLVGVAAFASSLLNDFAVRAVPKSGIYQGVFNRLAVASFEHPLTSHLLLRTLRLNCLTDAYADLWSEVMADGQMKAATEDVWTGGPDYPGRPALGDVTEERNSASPLRRASDRRQALVEIDALVALMLGVTADELCTIYRTQFAVLYGYDRTKYIYDANGREVPTPVLQTWRKAGLHRLTPEDQVAVGLPDESRTRVHPGSHIPYTYELPYLPRDREADMRLAYTHFEQVLVGQ
ncbi:class I SAM-dependent DNA methyltransferase [Nocardioides sp. NPDC006303]|uniref:class I SAM-dependent DNA methyltransferase n=1 Tax=Nocardioides sp. NPDC006303 TaxID=3156747 RepID=UPI0033B86C7A